MLSKYVNIETTLHTKKYLRNVDPERTDMFSQENRL